MTYSAELLLTADEVVLWGDRFGVISDVAFWVEFNRPDDWRIRAVGFVERFDKYKNHDINWITDGDPLETLIAKKLTDDWCEYIEDRIRCEMDHWERKPSRYGRVA